MSQTRLRLPYLALRFTQRVFDSFQRNVETVNSLLATAIQLKSRRPPCGSTFETFNRVLGALKWTHFFEQKRSDS